jgi:hypothetical protein
LGCKLNDEALPLTRLPEGAGWEWLALATLAALVVGAIAQVPGMPASAAWALRGAVAGNAGWLLTPAGLRSEHIWAPLVLGGVILAEWAVLETLAGKGWGLLLAALPAIVASVVLIYAGSLRFNQIALMLAGSLIGIGIAAALLRASASAASAGAALILPALLLAGWYDIESEVPTACFVLVALAPLTLAPSLLPAWQRHQRKGLWAVQLILLLLPLAVALILVAQLGPLEYE